MLWQLSDLQLPFISFTDYRVFFANDDKIFAAVP